MPSKHRLKTDPRTWEFPKLPAMGAFIIVFGLLLLLYPSTASWFSQLNQSKLIRELNTDHHASSTHRAVADAREYNRLLVGGVIVEADQHKATGTVQSEGPYDYYSLLNATDTGIMGRLRIKSIGVDLPIYHGTSDSTLAKGVGHLRGTALPVGGTSLRPVLTAHRGLPEATLFNDLDRIAVHDTFVVEVFGEVSTYKVIETRVIEPDDTQAISVEQGKDLLSLITCTPLGINTHRILVTGERIVPTPISDAKAAGAAPEIPGFPWWAVIGGSVVLVVISYVVYAGYSQGRRRQKKTSPAPETESNS